MNKITYVKFPKEIIYINLKNYYNEENMVNLPLLGTVAAGAPILADQQVEDYYTVPKSLVSNERDGFILKVKGESMIDAHIQEGDLLICKIAQGAQNGDIVVATIDNEATVKRYFREGDKICLQPENAKYQPIYVNSEFLINGIVVGLIREAPSPH